MSDVSSPGPVPKEALEFFAQKNFKPRFDYRDVWKSEHNVSFTVAKAMELDILETIRGEVERALRDGTTLADFQKTLEPRLVKAGWWGRQEMTDPVTGEVRDVQLGSPRRLETILRTNLRTARAAGQWARIQRTKEDQPFLIYRLGPSEHHRLEHAAWAGTVLPVDDEFWTTHMPPNGWGCKCFVVQASETQAERAGGESARPDTTPVPWENKRTGQTEMVPRGIEPGWNYNPGITRMPTAATAPASSAPPSSGKRSNETASPPKPRATARTRALRDGEMFDKRELDVEHAFAAFRVKVKDPVTTAVHEGIWKPNDHGMHAVHREVSAYHLDQLFDGPKVVPETLERVDASGRKGSIQLWRDSLGDLRKPAAEAAVAAVGAPIADRPSVRRTWMLDLIAGHADRHEGNLLARNVKGVVDVVPVDHGGILPSTVQAAGAWLPVSLHPERLVRLDAESVRQLGSVEPVALAQVLARTNIDREAARGALTRLIALRTNPNLIDAMPAPKTLQRRAGSPEALHALDKAEMFVRRSMTTSGGLLSAEQQREVEAALRAVYDEP